MQSELGRPIGERGRVQCQKNLHDYEDMSYD